MKPSGIGGMAVIEGVMMKNKDEYAIAVRKPNNEIVVEKSKHQDLSNKVKLFKLPILRGILAFIDSMVIGMKVMNFSASFFEEEEDTAKKDKKNKKKNKLSKNLDIGAVSEVEGAEEISATKATSEKADMSPLVMVVAVLFSVAISVSLFMVLPVLISGLFSKFLTSAIGLSFVESIIRVLIFICYVFLISLTPDIKRVFMYHGAEHKTINCLENGYELTVENVKKQPRLHKRCGTSFMLFVMIISFIFFIFLPTSDLLWRVVSRVLLVPIISGISYEFIRLAGRSENKLIHFLSLPGFWMQGLTTKEPDDKMIEVAITSVEAVFDWKGFLEEETAQAVEVKSVDEVVAAKVASLKNKVLITSSNLDVEEDMDLVQLDQIEGSAVTITSISQSEEGINKETSNVSKRTIIPSIVEEDEILSALDRYL